MKTVAFYIADQQKYVDEAIVSAKSLKKHMPDIDTFLFTPLNIESNPNFSSVVSVGERQSEFFFLDHARWMTTAFNYIYLNTMYEVAIFLDCDTFIASPFDDVFELLEHGFEILGVHAPGRQTTKTTNSLPRAFPEMNLGFNPFLVTQRTKMFFSYFIEIYEQNATLYGNNDQGAFRDALWSFEPCAGQRIRFYILPPEYNCRFNFPCFASGAVKILHGHAKDIAKVAEKINASTEMRSWKGGEVNE